MICEIHSCFSLCNPQRLIFVQLSLGESNPAGLAVRETQHYETSLLHKMRSRTFFEDPQVLAKKCPQNNDGRGSLSKYYLFGSIYAILSNSKCPDASKGEKKMKAVVLDMYGVIVKQTGDDFVPYVQQTFPQKKPEEIETPWFQADIGKLTSLDVWKAIGFQGDLEKIEKEYLDTIELNDGVVDFLKAVKGKEYHLAIISNDSSRWSKYLREKFALNQFFDVISISGDLKIQKPDERIFWLTIEKLGVKAEDCWYVDDRVENLTAAKKIGMHPVLLNSRKVSYNGDIVENFPDLAKKVLQE